MTSPRAVRSLRTQKSFAGGIIFALMLGFAGMAAAQEELKVAVVDVARIFREYARIAELTARIDEARHSYETEVSNRMEGHHRLVEELARVEKALENPGLGANEKADFEKKRAANLEETHQVENDLREFRGGRERAIQEMTLRVRTQVVEEIMVVINERVETKHYNLVLNKSGQGPGGRTTIVYANPSFDITDDVVATLNQTHPAAKSVIPPESP